MPMPRLRRSPRALSIALALLATVLVGLGATPRAARAQQACPPASGAPVAVPGKPGETGWLLGRARRGAVELLERRRGERQLGLRDGSGGGHPGADDGGPARQRVAVRGRGRAPPNARASVPAAGGTARRRAEVVLVAVAAVARVRTVDAAGMRRTVDRRHRDEHLTSLPVRAVCKTGPSPVPAGAQR
jgi:hypothetical protein